MTEKSETIFFPVFSQNFILNIIHILLSNKNAQIQKIMLTPLRYTPSDTKIIKNKVLPQKMWICGKIYFERFFNYFPFQKTFLSGCQHQKDLFTRASLTGKQGQNISGACLVVCVRLAASHRCFECMPSTLFCG